MLCVASRSGGIPEIIEHEVNGLLFESGNETELAEMLQRAVRACRDESWQVYVDNAREKVGKFDIRDMLDDLEAYNRKLVD